MLMLGCCTLKNSDIVTTYSTAGDTIEPTQQGSATSAGCSGNSGEAACDFKLLNHYGDEWHLYESYGSIIVLDFSTMWCAACQLAALEVQSIHDNYREKGVIWVTILLQDLGGLPPTIKEAVTWANAFGITTSPVLAGEIGIIDPMNPQGFSVKVLPTIVIIDRDMLIRHYIPGWNKRLVIDKINDLLGEDAGL